MTDQRRRSWLPLLPVVLFVGLAALFLKGLQDGDPSRLPSALIGRPVPDFSLPPLEGTGLPGLDTLNLREGETAVVNVWSSWCGPCRVEHPLLMELKSRGDLRLVGINYKDVPANARRFLASLGQPFSAIGVDQSGRTAIDLGVYGVPETFVIDGKGIVRFKWPGPLSPDIIRSGLEPAIAAANAAP